MTGFDDTNWITWEELERIAMCGDPKCLVCKRVASVKSAALVYFCEKHNRKFLDWVELQKGARCRGNSKKERADR